MVNGGITRRPENYLRSQQCIDLFEELNHSANLRNDILVTIRGGSLPGTWADERIALAYAAWLSAPFHRAVLETFQAASRGGGEAAVEVANNILFHIRSDSLLICTHNQHDGSCRDLERLLH